MKIGILDSNHNLPLLVEPDTERESSNLDNFLSWYRDNSELGPEIAKLTPAAK
ncbi:hypothetical protein IQ264_24570 [Phormidium sp. LEGE 05292]|uniref:hypothetical protein n=1 Tax=[Phormidium] sp. LEGE 05292 TaxID=767427 RepID=UPI00187FD9B2|nr:hypothetical protein [Phormidium sp. LEGE 05292]MBE9228588.1 hypothetical protein [Phormidium sp. LEGE 05292]